MKAMILAAGLGTRLGEISRTTPKCLVEAGGRTMLDHVFTHLEAAGVTEVVINLHHLADRIRAHVAAHPPRLTVHFSHEVEAPLDTGGGIRFAEPLLRDTDFFLVHNADIYTDLDLRGLITAHTTSAARPVATLAVMDRPTSRALLFSPSGELRGWDNSSGQRELLVPGVAAERLAFSGIQIISARIFDYLRDETGPFSIIRGYLKATRAGERVLGWRMDDAYWIDIGTPEKLGELRARLGG